MKPLFDFTKGELGKPLTQGFPCVSFLEGSASLFEADASRKVATSETLAAASGKNIKYAILYFGTLRRSSVGAAQ
jgi:hypothetical protein